MKINMFIKILFLVILSIFMMTSFSYAKGVENEGITVKYEYNEKTNEVIAYIISDIELKHTKPTWKLSEDRKTYTKTFTSNMSYSTPVENINNQVINVNLNITQIKMATITTEYEYNDQNGQVIAKIISNMPLKHTKPTWKLNQDRKTYTKIFTSNTSYSTPVQDINGNIINVELNVKIKTAQIKTEYEYNKNKNQVVAKIISDIPLRHTKPTWKLSEDRKMYTKTFTSSNSYSTPVQDSYGNVINAYLNIDLTPPKVTVEYKHNDDGTVTAYMKSNEVLADTKVNWVLSKDKLTYEHTFSTNQDYSTTVQDVNGLTTNVKIQFKSRKCIYEQHDKSTIIVKYLYIEKKQAIVEIVSSVKLINTKPTWKLSEDGYRYTKVFYDNKIYSTPFHDVNGSTKNVNIIVNLFDDYLLGIDVSKHNGKIDWEKVKNSEVDFVILRIGVGQDIESQDDPTFEYNVTECERLGIPYGVYLYSYALNVNNALSEADHVLRLIKGHNPTFGIWYDIEDADKYKENNGMPSNEDFTNIAIAFCEKIKANGYQNVGIYASYYWHDYILNDSKLDVYPKWVAQWGDNCTYEKEYVMWQFTDSGSVPGIIGNVDMNKYYK